MFHSIIEHMQLQRLTHLHPALQLFPFIRNFRNQFIGKHPLLLPLAEHSFIRRCIIHKPEKNLFFGGSNASFKITYCQLVIIDLLLL